MHQVRTRLDKAVADRVRESFSEQDFTRTDETDDTLFYARDRFLPHLDARALETVESIVEQLVVEEAPVILDLMASWDSHIPSSIRPSKLVGLGMNHNELRRNPSLTEHVVHDLNRDPNLPFSDGTFDVVLNTVSVDYMTRPFEVFAEIGRILKPAGLFVVVFSNRMFPTKAVRLWRDSSEEERVILVEEFLRNSGLFTRSQAVLFKGRPRPKDDKYARVEKYSDPVYAVYAERCAPEAGRDRPHRPPVEVSFGEPVPADELQARLKNVKHTHRCPHCQSTLSRLPVPSSPFVEWASDILYACLNDFCPFFVNGYSASYRDGQRGISYCFMYDPAQGRGHAMPVHSLDPLRAIAE